MNEVLLNGNCPNCALPFKPDMSFGNLHRCSGCKQWSVFINGRINENVIYKIIPFQQDKENLRKKLAQEICNAYDKKSFKKLGEVNIDAYYLPVREIKSGPERELISTNMEHHNLHTHFFKHKKDSDAVPCDHYDKILPTELQKDFSEDMIRDKSLVTLDVDIEKKLQDKEYDLPKYGFYKILYLPIYRITFTGSDERWYCLGLNDFPGLKESITPHNDLSGYVIHPWLVIAFVVLGGLKGCANTSNPFESLWHAFLGMLGGLLICLVIAAVRYLLWFKKENDREKAIGKKIHI